jgi:AcrR family transcriptional regulator
MGLKERRERERKERKKLILNAARSLLFEKGLNATSINLVAQRAELGVGTIYSYYSSKEEIFAALQEEGLHLLYTKSRKRCRLEKKPPAKLRGIAEVYIDFSENNSDYFDIINYFLSSPRVLLDEKLKKGVDRHGEEIIALIESVIQEGIEQRIFAPSAPRKDAILFWGTLHGLIQFKKLKNTILAGLEHGRLLTYAIERMIGSLERPPK